METNNTAPTSEPEVYLNGVDALTGQSLWKPQSPQAIAALASAEYEDTSDRDTEDLKTLSNVKFLRDFGWGGVSLDELAEASWGVIVAEGDTETPKKLKSLIERARIANGRAGTNISGKSGYNRG